MEIFLQTLSFRKEKTPGYYPGRPRPKEKA